MAVSSINRGEETPLSLDEHSAGQRREPMPVLFPNIMHTAEDDHDKILIVARDALILWVNLAVAPAELLFEAIEAELERRGVDARTRSSRDG
jgi:hypothetical protein